MVENKPTANNTCVISLRNASVVVDKRVVWSGATFDIAAGEFVAILGPNGAGKSSLLNVLLGTAHVTDGTAVVLGEKPGTHNSRIGYLPQRRSFAPSLRISGEDVVRFGVDGDRWGVRLPRFLCKSHERDRARVQRAISLVGATTFARRPIGELSGGEQQRLLIAQAMVRSPELLLLDEPLDSLDLPNQQAISALVKSMTQASGTTVLMVAHDVNPILSYIDRVIYVAGGKVVAGLPEEVIRSDVLSELYRTTVEVLRTAENRLVVVGAPDGHTHHSHG